MTEWSGTGDRENRPIGGLWKIDREKYHSSDGQKQSAGLKSSILPINPLGLYTLYTIFLGLCSQLSTNKEKDN